MSDHIGYTVDKVLGSRSKFCWLLVETAHAGLNNCSGSAYCCHPQCYRSDSGRVVLVNDWNTNDYCSVRVVDTPGATILRGANDSWGRGNPFPRASEGELVTVWNDGKWVKHGPWDDAVRETVAELIEKLMRHRAQTCLEKHVKVLVWEKEKVAADKKLEAAWA